MKYIKFVFKKNGKKKKKIFKFLIYIILNYILKLNLRNINLYGISDEFFYFYTKI